MFERYTMILCKLGERYFTVQQKPPVRSLLYPVGSGGILFADQILAEVVQGYKAKGSAVLVNDQSRVRSDGKGGLYTSLAMKSSAPDASKARGDAEDPCGASEAKLIAHLEGFRLQTLSNPAHLTGETEPYKQIR